MIHPRAALLIAGVLSFAPAARAATVWTAMATEKIRGDAAARPDAHSVAIAAAKNEFESFQVVVTGPASNVSASFSELKGPGTITGVKLYREALLDIGTPSSLDGATGPIPDPLVPDVDEVVGEKRNAFPFDVPAGASRAIWVDVHVPQDAAAGVYQGTVTIHMDQGDQQVPVALTVWDFALPSTASLKSTFALTGGLQLQHRSVNGDALSQLRVRYAQVALDHRISIGNAGDDGVKDWGHYDQFYGPLIDGHAQTQLAGAKLTQVQATANLASVPEQADWAAHFRSHGWFDRLFQYTCDEPPITCNWGDIPVRAAAAKAADPQFRTLVTTYVENSDANGVTSSIDIMVPPVNFMDERGPENHGWRSPGGEKRPLYDGFVSQGAPKELWMYQACMSHGCGGTVDMGNPSAENIYFTGWPTYMVDASSVRNRAMEWLTFRYGAVGELYYETIQAYYDHDPWQNVFDFNGNGDGTLFYPGTPEKIGGQTDIPVSSVRLKMIREGMEDFEYLKLLADLGDASSAKQIAQALFPRAWQTEQKPEDLMGAREAIARKILALMGKPVPPAGASAPGASVARFEYLITGSGCGSSSTGRGGAGLVTALLAPIALAWRGLRRRRRAAA